MDLENAWEHCGVTRYKGYPNGTSADAGDGGEAYSSGGPGLEDKY